MSLEEFAELAHTTRYRPPDVDDYNVLERKYWSTLNSDPPIYGADVEASLTDPDCNEFNITKLNTILDLINNRDGTILGVNTAYLYFGMWKSTFPWHTEDVDLYSINYLHFGKPKSWYCVPPAHGKKLEKTLNSKLI